jgi:hypothetical protein
MAISEQEIQAFADFLREEAAADGAELGIRDLAEKWEAAREREEVNAAIRAGIEAIEDGRVRPFDESQAEFRRANNLPPLR